MTAQITPFLRYPGSKRRLLHLLAQYLPNPKTISGRFIEPFVGGGAVYFYLQPKSALLTDINPELIELYTGIQRSPGRVWQLYRSYPNTKNAYKLARDQNLEELSLLQRAARSLYLNRTCFKGMWRHNLHGKFNIGYGGQSRRWSIRRRDLIEVSKLLRRARITCTDFEPVIASAKATDYLFLDPPYRPGEREQLHRHYSGRFSFSDHRRLAFCLRRADKRGVPWAITISGHRDVLRLYAGYRLTRISTGISANIVRKAHTTDEVLISNS